MIKGGEKDLERFGGLIYHEFSDRFGSFTKAFRIVYIFKETALFFSYFEFLVLLSF